MFDNTICPSAVEELLSDVWHENSCTELGPRFDQSGHKIPLRVTHVLVISKQDFDCMPVSMYPQVAMPTEEPSRFHGHPRYAGEFVARKELVARGHGGPRPPGIPVIWCHHHSPWALLIPDDYLPAALKDC